MIEYNRNANGGTELICKRLENSGLDLSDFQIVPSRVRELKENKIRIYYCHDLADDPETNHLANGGWNKFNHIVFVSNHQMQQYIRKYNIPWSHCTVIENAIEPFSNSPSIQKIRYEKSLQSLDEVNLVYTSTPHRGLDILLYVFDNVLKNTKKKIHLDVFSSFNLYGWPERDEQFRNLFAFCEQHPNITYHGSKPNTDVRYHLTYKSHIWCLPSTWEETSCLALIEAMCAGNVCVHSNLGALYETAGDNTVMYHYNENPYNHAQIFQEKLLGVINEKIDATTGFNDTSKFMLDTYIAKWDKLLKKLNTKSL